MGDNPRPPATGYPYAPPVAQPGYTYNPYPYPTPSPRATLLRRLLAASIAATVILGIILFIVWLVLRPRLPVFHVSSLSLSNFNTSTSPPLVTGNWDVRLSVRNPNGKTGLYYDRITVSVFYADELITRTNLPPFAQGNKNQTAIRAELVAVGVYVDKQVVDEIGRERGAGRVEFNVGLAVVVRFKVGFWRARRRWVRVYCRDLEVGLTAGNRNGTLAGGGERGCRVGL